MGEIISARWRIRGYSKDITHADHAQAFDLLIIVKLFAGLVAGLDCPPERFLPEQDGRRHVDAGAADTQKKDHVIDFMDDHAVIFAVAAGIDLEPAVIAKFNSTSAKNGLSTFLTDASEVQS